MNPISIGILHVGAPAGGINMATRTAVRLALGRGHRVLGIHDGFRGLADGDITPLQWLQVDDWTRKVSTGLYNTLIGNRAALDLELIAQRQMLTLVSSLTICKNLIFR